MGLKLVDLPYAQTMTKGFLFCSRLTLRRRAAAIVHVKFFAMLITPDNKLKKLIIIGDRVLLRPSQPTGRTDSGLYLPPGVGEKERVQQGTIIKTGPGYAIPTPLEEEPWKAPEEQVKYLPLQAREGDTAIFLLAGATEIQYGGEKFFIVPQSAILMLEREEEL